MLVMTKPLLFFLELFVIIILLTFLLLYFFTLLISFQRTSTHVFVATFAYKAALIQAAKFTLAVTVSSSAFLLRRLFYYY